MRHPGDQCSELKMIVNYVTLLFPFKQMIIKNLSSSISHLKTQLLWDSETLGLCNS